MQTMSRVVRFHTLGGPEILKIESRAVPDPGVDEVLIKVEAIGLNRADVTLHQFNPYALRLLRKTGVSRPA